MRGRERLRRRDRLRAAREFQRVRRVGKRFVSPELVVLVAPARQQERPRRGHGGLGPGARRRLGVTVSRKVGNAVVRNRVKRGIREWFRRCRCLGAGDLDVVVIAGPAVARWGPGKIGVRLSQLVESRRSCGR